MARWNDRRNTVKQLLKEELLIELAMGLEKVDQHW